MLVLGRKIGEKVVIANDVVVTVVAIKGDTVKLGFEGPREVPIHREEVYQRIQAERTTLSVSPVDAYLDCVALPT